jgi:HEAT repeat protein
MQIAPQTTTGGQQPQSAASPAPQAPKPVPPPEFQSEKIDASDQADLINLLKDSAATTFQKAKACQRLSRIGTAEAVPAMAPLLSDANLSTYARNGIQAIPGPAADDALRGAMPKLKGTLLIGVINSIGFRRDAKAVAPLSKLLYDSDPEVARASAAALGRISGEQAALALRGGLGRTKDPVRTAVADACLVCAEGLLASGQRAPAMSLYDSLIARDIPKPVRLAAMHGIISAETSLSRPR